MTQDTDDFIETPEEAEQIESIRAWMTREGIGLDELIDLLDLYVPVTPPVYVPLKARDRSPWVVDLLSDARNQPEAMRTLIFDTPPDETPLMNSFPNNKVV
tara:strand:+ start:266 stop:568 length:303 start_codon:yes stop_codon:yes gene_type:complete